jgi:hypothetical protein
MQAHGSGSADAHIYRWQGDGPWRRITDGLPDPLSAMPYAFATANGPLFAGLADGQLYRSDDRGESWRALALDGAPIERLLALVFLPDGVDAG